MIALYLYTIVVKRIFRTESQWRAVMKQYHFFVWGVSFFVILVVGVANKEGQSYSDDDSVQLQWCWINGNSRSDQFYWELAGGKLVEWASCIYIPINYILIIMKLYSMNERSDSSNGGSRTNSNIGHSLHSTGGLKSDIPYPNSEGLDDEANSDSDSDMQSSDGHVSVVSGVSNIDTISLQSHQSIIPQASVMSPEMNAKGAEIGLVSDDGNGLRDSLGLATLQAATSADARISFGTIARDNETVMNTFTNTANPAGLYNATSNCGRDRDLSTDNGARDRNVNSERNFSNSSSQAAGPNSVNYFNKFFRQMLIVPFVFFFARSF